MKVAYKLFCYVNYCIAAFKKVLDSCSLGQEDAEIIAQTLNKALRNHNYANLSPEQLAEYSVKIIKAMKWLGLFSASTKVHKFDLWV